DSLKIVYTPLHGAGAVMVPEVLRRAGLKQLFPVDSQMAPDGNFPTVKFPNPEFPEAFNEGIAKYKHARPFTKESLLYRDLFEKYYPGQSRMVTDFWMPNKDWEGCNVDDPSARVLSNYGASGE
ncbi:MAG: hypothetical protein II915_06465, partial [Eubacterium sp.]|nr:hypothetical protein [Eubacterium sp.]